MKANHHPPFNDDAAAQAAIDTALSHCPRQGRER